MPRSVYAIARDCQSCLARLNAAGFRSDEISLLAADDGAAPRPADSEAQGRKAWLPAVGMVLVCGPLSLLLRGGGTGAEGENLAKPLSELGVPAYSALRYEHALSRGATVVAVHTDNGFEVDTLTELLRDGGCEHVATA